MTVGTLKGTLPVCLVARGGNVSLTPNQWIKWHPNTLRKPLPLPPEWVLRELQAIDLGDPLLLLTLLNLRGMVWGAAEELRNTAETPAELAAPEHPPEDDPHVTVHLSDAHTLLSALQAAGAQWVAHVRDAEPLPETFWWVLHVGTSEFTHVATTRSDHLEGDLFEAGCWQLFCITQDRATVKRCQNETCGRIFYRQDTITRYEQSWSTGTKYCSTRCREAQKKRTSRRRLRTTTI